MLNKPRLFFKRHRLLRLLLLICLVIVVFSIIATIPIGRSGKITVGTLSERAQEFIQSEQEKGSANWRNKDVAVSPLPAKGQTVIKTRCYTATLPFPIRSIEKVNSDKCLATIRMASPPGRLTISLATLQSPLAEHSAITMREATVDTYSPVEFSSALFPDSKTYTDPQGVSYFAEANGELLSVVFSETIEQEKIVQQTLTDTLQSIQIIPLSERLLEQITPESLQ